jgi:glycosyltransferase involved in cell wall biosynthesis
MKRPLLTVLTAPVPTARRRVYEDLSRRIRPIVKPGAPLRRVSPYPGHHALVRSVVEGLRAIGADFNFNPRRLEAIGPVVYAPANEALLQAAGLKRAGAVEYLVAGPVNALFADECDNILLTPEIDRVIVASEWVLDLFGDAPQLAAKSRVCPCGVDAEYWKPSGRARRDTAVVYWKSGDEAFCRQVEQIVRACGLEPRRLHSRAGEHEHFSSGDFKKLLDEARAAVFLSTFETQGLALSEAWSMDVPTMVWDPRGRAEWRGHSFQAGSSAPYLTPATGRLWRTLDELEPALRGMLAEQSPVRPREWLVAHMTDAICSAALYDIIHEGAAAFRRKKSLTAETVESAES